MTRGILYQPLLYTPTPRDSLNKGPHYVDVRKISTWVFGGDQYPTRCLDYTYLCNAPLYVVIDASAEGISDLNH